jgi:TM2 domain-containing membrane protein YozV
MKEKIIAALLAFFLGEWGIHKFYLNEQKQGKRYLIWCVVGIVLVPVLIGLIPLIVLLVKKLIDCFSILFMTDEEFDEKYNGRNRKILND